MSDGVRILPVPDLGEGLSHAKLVEWHVEPGADVKADQLLATVETDKAVVEIPCPWTGRVGELFCAPGEQVRVGAPMASFEGLAALEIEPDPDPAETRDRKMLSRLRPVAAPASRIRAMPAARKRARALGVDLSRVTPTGPDAAITVLDVERAANETSAAPNRERQSSTRIGFLFGARDALWQGIGIALCDRGDVIGESLRRSEEYIARRLGWSLRRELSADAMMPEYVLEAANTAVQIALCDAWTELGIRPDAAIGRCGGEMAAAYSAGNLSSNDALEAACRVSDMIQRGLAGTAAMYNVYMEASRFDALQSDCPVTVWLIADHVDKGGRTSVVGCRPDDAPALVDYLSATSLEYWASPIKIAPHTDMIEHWRSEILRPMPEAVHRERRAAVYSAALCGRVDDQSWPDHLWDVVRRPVLIGPVIRQAADDGITTFVEVGGRATLEMLVRDEVGIHEIRYLPTMQPQADVAATMLKTKIELEAISRYKCSTAGAAGWIA